MFHKFMCSILVLLALCSCSGCRKKVCKECKEEECTTIVQEKRVSGPYADPRAKEDLELY